MDEEGKKGEESGYFENHKNFILYPGQKVLSLMWCRPGETDLAGGCPSSAGPGAVGC